MAFLAGGTVVEATGAGACAVWTVRNPAFIFVGLYLLPCPLRRLCSCCNSSRVAPNRASASVTNAPTAGARCRVMACCSASVGSGTMVPRRQASVNRVRLHPLSGPFVAASRFSAASAPFWSVMGRVSWTCRHIRAASWRNLAPSLPAASSPLKARSSAVWAWPAVGAASRPFLNSVFSPRRVLG